LIEGAAWWDAVDSKDFRLLVALHENARLSYRSLGQRVTLSAPAVRERLNRLERRGILQGYWLYIDPNILDREDFMVFYRGDWNREDALKALDVADVAFVAWKLDGSLSVQVWPRDRAKPIKDLTMALEIRPSGQTFTNRREEGQMVSLIDLRIMDALVDDPLISFDVLVMKTGLSPKTVRKHLRQLIKDETIFIMPRLGSLGEPGDLVYHLTVSGKVGRNELRHVLGEALVVSETSEPPLKYLLCRADDLAEVTLRTQAVRRLSGVDSVEVTLNKELMVGKEFVHSLIRQKIREQERKRETD
jgi:DNA-binding Lrp family transcriptional regulator